MSNNIYDEKRLGYSVWLRKVVNDTVFDYLDRDCRKLIYDSKCLLEYAKNSSESYSDYSFLLAPLYKAVEGTFIKIAKDLEIKLETDRVGSYFNEENVNKFVIKLQEESVTNRPIEDIRNQLIELKVFYRRYRNNPAHYNSDFKELARAEAAHGSAIYNLGCVVSELYKLKLIRVISE